MTMALAKSCTHSKIDLKQKQRRKSNPCKSFNDFWRFYSNIVNPTCMAWQVHYVYKKDI